MSPYVVGQRFVSEAEPELGLGRVEHIERRSLVLHLSFTIADERYCREAEAGDGGNPFLLVQTVIAALPFLAADGKRREQIEAAGYFLTWDHPMVVVPQAEEGMERIESAISGAALRLDSLRLLFLGREPSES